MIRRRPIRTDGWPRRLVPVVIGVLPVHGRLLAAIDPPVRNFGQVEGALATAWPGRGRFSPDTVHVTLGLADGQRINVDMNRLLAARVREGEAVTVRKSRTLPGRVAYADAIPSRDMPPSGAAAKGADVAAPARERVDAGTGPVAGKAPR